MFEFLFCKLCAEKGIFFNFRKSLNKVVVLIVLEGGDYFILFRNKDLGFSVRGVFFIVLGGGGGGR